MSENDIFYLIKAKKATLALIVLVFVIIALGLSLLQSLKYTSNLRLLVVQKAGANADPYALSKSNEYLGQLLSKVAYSNTFYNKVLETDTSINRDYFGSSLKEQAKNWERSIDVRNIKETGIINIKAYHSDRSQAERLARAVALTIMTQHSSYHGMGDAVMIRLLDEPLTSNYPDQPNLFINFIAAIVGGLVFGTAWIYLKYASKNFNITPENNITARDMYREAYMESNRAEIQPSNDTSNETQYHERSALDDRMITEEISHQPRTDYPWQTPTHN